MAEGVDELMDDDFDYFDLAVVIMGIFCVLVGLVNLLWVLFGDGNWFNAGVGTANVLIGFYALKDYDFGG